MAISPSTLKLNFDSTVLFGSELNLNPHKHSISIGDEVEG